MAILANRRPVNLGNTDPAGPLTVGGPAPLAAGPIPSAMAIPGVASYTAPTAPGSAPTPTAFGNFNAPSMSDYLNSQEYGDELGQSEKALQRSAAARGTLLTGSTLRSLQDNAARVARQGYQQHFTNALGAYEANRGTNAQNFGQTQTAFGDTLGLYDRSVDAAGRQHDQQQAQLDQQAETQNAQSAEEFARQVANQRATAMTPNTLTDPMTGRLRRRAAMPVSLGMGA